ncbi:MAG: YfcE family phosphodiesterase [Pseudomonadaceae bacterium]|nr:YfcE family phosphodiesterase [Pseudomonadaceae bacterium]
MHSEFASADTLRVGLIADTHMPGTIATLWPQVYDAFRGTDLILHAGDLHVADVIDELETLAPTFVCCGNGDLDVQHAKLKDVWCGQIAGLTVGLVHKFPTPSRAQPAKLHKKRQQAFGETVPHVVIYGHTHLAEVHDVEGCVYINPGSPTLPNNQSTRHGTVGFLSITPSSMKVELLQIVDDGLSPLHSIDISRAEMG